MKNTIRIHRDSMTALVLMQVAEPRHISHHRPPAISRKIGSVWRAGGGSGAERRSRNSVRVRSYDIGSGAPVAVWPRARTRVASLAVPTPTPHEYPGESASSPVGARVDGARISVTRGPRAASGALPARWPPCSGGGAWRCCGWSRFARLPPARPVSARRRPRRPPPAPRKMRSLARARPPILQNPRPRRRRRRRPRRPTYRNHPTHHTTSVSMPNIKYLQVTRSNTHTLILLHIHTYTRCTQPENTDRCRTCLSPLSFLGIISYLPIFYLIKTLTLGEGCDQRTQLIDID